MQTSPCPYYRLYPALSKNDGRPPLQTTGKTKLETMINHLFLSFSHHFVGFPMVFPWFSHGSWVIFPWFSRQITWFLVVPAVPRGHWHDLRAAGIDGAGEHLAQARRAPRIHWFCEENVKTYEYTDSVYDYIYMIIYIMYII